MDGETWILNQCYSGTCTGEKGIYWIRLHFNVTQDGDFVAYVIQGTTQKLHKGRNFVFFNFNLTAYILTSVSDMAIYNLDQRNNGPFTSDTPGIGREWHLHGGNLVHWWDIF